MHLVPHCREGEVLLEPCEGSCIGKSSALLSDVVGPVRVACGMLSLDLVSSSFVLGYVMVKLWS